MLKFLVLIGLLFTSGCTINHQVTLDKRLSYQSEKELTNFKFNHPRWGVQGAELNLKVYSSIHNESGIGEAHRYILDVGNTFNELLDQASNKNGYICESSCNKITVELISVKLNASGGFGFNYTKITSIVKINFPDQFNNLINPLRTYNFEIKDENDLPPKIRSYYTQIYFIEKTIIAILAELDSEIQLVESESEGSPRI
jgi:hypothetical protein